MWCPLRGNSGSPRVQMIVVVELLILNKYYCYEAQPDPYIYPSKSVIIPKEKLILLNLLFIFVIPA